MSTCHKDAMSYMQSHRDRIAGLGADPSLVCISSRFSNHLAGSISYICDTNPLVRGPCIHDVW